MQTSFASKALQILNDAFRFYTAHFQQLATLCLPFLFVTTLLDFVLARSFQESAMALFGPMMVNLLIYPIYTAALIHLMARRARGERPGNGNLLMAAMRQWAPLFLLKTILVAMIGLGISLLIIPGIWLAVRLAYAEFYLVLFGQRPLDAIRISFIRTRPHFLLILLLLLTTYVPIVLMGIGTDQILQTVLTNDFFRVLASTGWSFIGLLVSIVMFRLFMETMEAGDEPAPPGPIGGEESL